MDDENGTTNDNFVGMDSFLQDEDTKPFEGKFLTRVRPEDLDEKGRFICDEPVLVIGAHAFQDVKDLLTYVKIDGVVSIENDAFADCVFLKKADINFELGYKYLENYDMHMFWKDKVVDSEDDFYYLESKFSEKYGLYDVHIKDGAFKNCVRLESFHFPARVVLHNSPFPLCNSMTEVIFDGSIRLAISAELVNNLGEDEMPFKAITFKDCDNVQKITFGKNSEIDVSQIAEFPNLKEIKLNCDFFERRKFWKEAIKSYPQFYLILPTDLYNDKRFVASCLYSVPDTLEEVYGYPASKQIYERFLKRKDQIEKHKSKEKSKSQRIERVKRRSDSRNL